MHDVRCRCSRLGWTMSIITLSIVTASNFRMVLFVCKFSHQNSYWYVNAYCSVYRHEEPHAQFKGAVWRYSVIFLRFFARGKMATAHANILMSRTSDHDSSASRANNFSAQAESRNCRFPQAIVILRGLALWPPLFFPHKIAAKITDYRDTAALIYFPSLAWLHTWRGCPTAREDPGCSRPLHPPSSVAHTQKWTTPSSRLAITPLAAWNRKFVSAPSLCQPSTRATDKLPTTLCLFSQSAIPEEAKATDSSCSPDNETHHLFLL